jgi:hypothetical protein
VPVGQQGDVENRGRGRGRPEGEKAEHVECVNLKDLRTGGGGSGLLLGARTERRRTPRGRAFKVPFIIYAGFRQGAWTLAACRWERLLRR